MDNSIYVSLSRQLTLFRDMDVTANNIANANTTGYSAEHILFNTYLTKDDNDGERNPLAFANDISTYRNTENGSLRPTGNDLDVAIQGNGFFVVQTPLGKRYTRSGNFQIDGSGQLATAEGYPVLDNTGQAISMPDNTTSIEIGSIGNIKVNGNDNGNLAVVQFANPQLLERSTGKLFKSDIEGQPATTDFRVAQGMLENSNVQPVSELTHMMTLTHAVTDTAQMIAIVYDLQRKASNAWAAQS